MNTIRCEGLDGSNPLHFLAALGVLRLRERIAPGVTMCWVRPQGVWNPELVMESTCDAFLPDVVEWLHELAKTTGIDPSARRAVETNKTALKRLNEQLKVERAKVKEQIRQRGLTGDDAKQYEKEQLASIYASIAAREADLDAARVKLADAYGDGIAHFGDVIGVAPAIVRSRAETSVKAFLAARSATTPSQADVDVLVSHLAALACDQVADGGKVAPTRYSFGNGSGGQCLLKDWRNLAAMVTVEQMRATLMGTGQRVVCGATNLNWDPAANRSYALNWNSPDDKTNNPKQTDVAANALAYVGLGFMSVMPVGGRLSAVGWGPGDQWTWPLWETPIQAHTVRSLLAHEMLMQETSDTGITRALGVVEVRRSDRIDPSGQGRPYFSPSRPV